MRCIVFGTILVILGLINLLQRNPENPTGSIVVCLVFVAAGGTLIFFGVRHRKQNKAEQIHRGLAVAPAPTPLDMAAQIASAFCGLLCGLAIISVFSIFIHLFGLSKPESMFGTCVLGGFAFVALVAAIQRGIRGGKGVHRFLQRKYMNRDGASN